MPYNPFWIASDWGDLAINATLSAYMNGYNDPRISKYMNTSTSYREYRGVRMGIKDTSKSVEGSAARYSKPAVTDASPMPVFYAAETYFLKAEAALQGWIAGGTAAAKSYYEQGIQISMNQYGVEIGDYLSSTVVPQGYTDRWNSQIIFHLLMFLLLHGKTEVINFRRLLLKMDCQLSIGNRSVV